MVKVILKCFLPTTQTIKTITSINMTGKKRRERERKRIVGGNFSLVFTSSLVVISTSINSGANKLAYQTI